MPIAVRGVAALVLVLLLALAGPAGAQVTWTPIASGTTADITAIDYQSDARAWFATADGRIFRALGDGSFVQGTGTLAGAAYSDVAFQPGGAVGLAVTTDGRAQRSTNGGASWSTIALLNTHRACNNATSTAVQRLHGVFWAGAGTAYFVGGGGGNQPIVLRGIEPIVTPVDVNTIAPGGGCRVGELTNSVADGFALPADPSSLRFITDDFGDVFATSDALATPASYLVSLTIGTGGVPRLAVDPANPSSMWATSTVGGLFYAASGPSRRPMVRADTGLPVSTVLHDLAYAGGTLVAAGDGGAIYTSRDGTIAHLQGAGGAHASTGWRAADLAGPNEALVGGAGGALVKSANASALPATPTPPPSDGRAGPPPSGGRRGSRRAGGGASLTPPNASQPANRSTGGASLTLWKRIALSEGRYVPVRVSARSRRRFVIEIRRAQRPRRRVAMAKARLSRRGRKLVRVPLRRSVRTGRYRIVVRVFVGRRQIGRRITLAFVINR